jgi:hypothetical protein
LSTFPEYLHEKSTTAAYRGGVLYRRKLKNGLRTSIEGERGDENGNERRDSGNHFGRDVHGQCGIGPDPSHMTLTLNLINGFSFGRPVRYLSMDTSNTPGTAIEHTLSLH